MQKYSWIWIALALLCLISDASARCKIPKEHTVCMRQCFYNPYGPGAHCNEQCVKKKFQQPRLVCHQC